MFLEQNIKGICEKFGLDFEEFLDELDAENVKELTVFDLEAIAEEYELDVHALIFKPCFHVAEVRAKLDHLKLLVLDVDGVMTDGGMYFTESGDQFKKFNTKDGMAILHLTKSDFQVAIISSGFIDKAVKARAEMLGIQHCVVTREPKINVLKEICEELEIKLDQVAIIGDDINDQEIMRNVGVSFCPSDAVDTVKEFVDVVLSKKGGHGCVREAIDQYILKQPLSR